MQIIDANEISFKQCEVSSFTKCIVLEIDTKSLKRKNYVKEKDC